MSATPDWPELGFGVGLRAEHYQTVLGERPNIDWFEALTENYMDTRGRPLSVLEAVRRDYPVALHGVALSIGSADPLDRKYLRSLKELSDRIEPVLITDHLCWTGVRGRSFFDLLPLPYNEETLEHVTRRVEQVQNFLGRRILLENASAYLAYRTSTIPEWEFISEVATRADCGILLDVNNLYVSAKNLGFDPIEYLNGIARDRVGQFHLAGYTDMGSYLFDTHSRPVYREVWELYEHAVRRFGPGVPTLIEWDADIPPFERLSAEAQKAKAVARCAADTLGKENASAA